MEKAQLCKMCVDRNVGHPVDIAARVVIGLVLLSMLFYVESSVRWLGLIGLVPLLTVAFGWCPAYALFGLSTYNKPKEH